MADLVLHLLARDPYLATVHQLSTTKLPVGFSPRFLLAAHCKYSWEHTTKLCQELHIFVHKRSAVHGIMQVVPV